MVRLWANAKVGQVLVSRGLLPLLWAHNISTYLKTRFYTARKILYKQAKTELKDFNVHNIH